MDYTNPESQYKWLIYGLAIGMILIIITIVLIFTIPKKNTNDNK